MEIENRSSPSITYFLEEPGQRSTAWVFLCPLESQYAFQQEHSFMASLVSFRVCRVLSNPFIHCLLCSGVWDYGAGPSLPPCRLQPLLFHREARCAQRSTSWVRLLESVMCFLRQHALPPGVRPGSFSLKNRPHFSVPQGFGSVTHGCHVKITF